MQKRQQFLHQSQHRRLIDQRVGQFQRAAANRNISVAKALENNAAMALHRIGINRHNLDECVERHVSDIVVRVPQELAQDVDRHDAQTRIRFDFEDGQHTLVEDTVAHRLGAVGVRRYLREDVVDGVRDFHAVTSQYTQKAQDLGLQEWIGDTCHVVLGRKARRKQSAKCCDEGRRGLRQHTNTYTAE